MTHPFRDSYIKLSRAKAHLADLERIQTAWSDSTLGGQQIGPNESFLSTRSKRSGCTAQLPRYASLAALLGLSRRTGL